MGDIGHGCPGHVLVSIVAASLPIRLAALVLGAAVRQDGKSASLTAPNGQAQQALLRTALADSTLTADDLVCVEAHGTGTALGDPIESGSLSGAYLSARAAATSPLALGSLVLIRSGAGTEF